VTDDPDVAFRFFCEGIDPSESFPLNRQWITATNRLANGVNITVQEWRRLGGARPLGICRARAELVRPLANCPGLPEQQQNDYIEGLESSDLPPAQLKLFKGDVLLLLRNVDTRHGLAKRKRCLAQEMSLMTVVVAFEGLTMDTFGRMRREQTSNGVSFVRWQLPFRVVYAGIAHRLQGQMLDRVVVDCRAAFWEHDQLHVGFSRVTSPHGLCVLVPRAGADARILPSVDQEVVAIVESLLGARPWDRVGRDEDYERFGDDDVDPDGQLPDREGLGREASDAHRDAANEEGDDQDDAESRQEASSDVEAEEHDTLLRFAATIVFPGIRELSSGLAALRWIRD
jgi:hypothetical protein